MSKQFQVTFPNGHTARAVQIFEQSELAPALKDLGLVPPRPTIVLVGGAARMVAPILHQLHDLFLNGIARFAEDRKLYVVDGATDAGVIQMIGQARAELGAQFDLIGVAASGTVALPELGLSSRKAWALEPNHTHFVFVPGADWGDEVEWISRTASLLSGNARSATLLVNGGDIAWNDVEESVRARRPVLIAEGSGRTADVLVRALRGEKSSNRARALIESGLLHSVNLDSTVVRGAIEKILSTKE